MLHVAAHEPSPRVWTRVFRDALGELGELEIVENGEAMSPAERAELFRGCDIALTSWGAAPLPAELADEPGRLGYVCHVNGSVRGFVPRELIESDVPVTNWGDAISSDVAEGAMALLLAMLCDLPERVRAVREGGWRLDPATHGGTLAGADVGIYGLGTVGLRFVEMIRPFHPRLRVYDPYAPYVPPDCQVVATLDELFAASRILVIHAGLSDETRGSVTAELLAKLPDHGIVINTARGAIVDEEALMAELETGRLRAGLDVLVTEPMPVDHPARQWDNVLITGHQAALGWPTGGKEPTEVLHFQHVCLDNLRRYLAGAPLRFLMTPQRYDRST